MEKQITVDNISILARSFAASSDPYGQGGSEVNAVVKITGKELEDVITDSSVRRSTLCLKCANLAVVAQVHTFNEYEWGFEVHLWVEDIIIIKPKSPFGEA